MQGSRVVVSLTSVALSATVPSPWEQPGPNGGTELGSSSSEEGSDVSDAEGSASDDGADSPSEEDGEVCGLPEMKDL
mgnify:CR=1 FL=1